jgi:hypothetical protein
MHGVSACFRRRSVRDGYTPLAVTSLSNVITTSERQISESMKFAELRRASAYEDLERRADICVARATSSTALSESPAARDIT